MDDRTQKANQTIRADAARRVAIEQAEQFRAAAEEARLLHIYAPKTCSSAGQRGLYSRRFLQPTLGPSIIPDFLNSILVLTELTAYHCHLLYIPVYHIGISTRSRRASRYIVFPIPWLAGWTKSTTVYDACFLPIRQCSDSLDAVVVAKEQLDTTRHEKNQNRVHESFNGEKTRQSVPVHE